METERKRERERKMRGNGVVVLLEVAAVIHCIYMYLYGQHGDGQSEVPPTTKLISVKLFTHTSSLFSPSPTSVPCQPV